MALTKATFRMTANTAANIVDYGADPTGTTNSTSALAAAIADSDVVYIPAGTYLINDWLDFDDVDNKVIYGDGPEVCTLKKGDGATRGGRMFYLEDCTNICLDGFTIDGNGSNQTDYDQDSAIEIWKNAEKVTIRNLRIKDALRYGIYFKGSTTTGIPDQCLIEYVHTSGSLGTDSSGTVGALGKTGLAVIAAQNLTITNCTFDDLFDVEPNTTDQFMTGKIEKCVFNAGADFNFNDTPAGSNPALIIDNIFYGSTLRASELIQLKGGVFQNNLVTMQKGNTTILGGDIAVGIPTNNAGFLQVSNNRILGFKIGVALGIMNKTSVTDNFINATPTGTGTSSYDGLTFPDAGISIAATAPIRGGYIANNKVNVPSGFTAAGGYGIHSNTTDVRSVHIVGNSVMEDDIVLGAIYTEVVRNRADYIADNNATVKTGITGSNNVVSYKNNRFVIDGAVRTAAPSGGTFAVGDRALVTNATDSSGVAGENFDEWYYTSGDGSSTAQWTKSGTIA